MAATAVVAPYDLACSNSRNRKRTMPAVKTAKARPGACAPITERTCETSPHATKQSREGQRPQPGCALAFLFLALFPSSLDANDQADRKGNGEAFDEFEGVHGLPCFPHGIAVTGSTWFGLERPRLDPYQCWGADVAATEAIRLLRKRCVMGYLWSCLAILATMLCARRTRPRPSATQSWSTFIANARVWSGRRATPYLAGQLITSIYSRRRMSRWR